MHFQGHLSDLLWLLAPAALLVLIWRWPIPSRTRAQQEVGVKVTDPVCRMQLDTAKAAAQVRHEGETYYFCAEGCLKQFEQNPAQYVKRA